MQGLVMMAGNKAACLAASSTEVVLKAKPLSASGERLSLEDECLCARMRQVFRAPLPEGMVTLRGAGQEFSVLENAEGVVTREEIEIRFTVDLSKVLLTAVTSHIMHDHTESSFTDAGPMLPMEHTASCSLS
jgi:hypothetical protein